MYVCVPKCMNYHEAISGLVITGRAHLLSAFLTTHLLHSSYFCRMDLSTLCVS